MDPLTLAACWNNWGIQLLLESHTQHAMDAFQRARHLMRDLTEIMTHNSSQDEESEDSPLPTQHASDSSSVEAGNIHLRTYRTRSSFDKGVYYLYNRPFALPMSFSLNTSEELANYLVTSSAVIAFNHAIACHQYGKKSGLTVPIKQAVKSYELALRILQRAGSQEFGKFLTCLSLNNLANIESDLCNFERSERCLEHLRILLDNDPYIQEFALDFMDNVEWSNLELNVVCSQCAWSAQAA